MFRFTIRECAILAPLGLLATTLPPVGQAHAMRGWEISTPSNLHRAAADSALASNQEAQEFLARNLPIATAANPRYRSANGNQMAWITKTVAFAPGEGGHGARVSMTEEVLEFHNGARISTGSHNVAFAIEDVTISERRDSDDLTEAGDVALAVMFTCKTGKCIEASYDGKPSPSDWTDISIQDDAMRNKILQAFEIIQKAK